MISKKPSSFRSGTPLNSWQNLIYSAVPIKLETIADHHSQRDIENPTDCFISSVVDVKRRLHAMFWDVAENFVPQIKHIREKKLLHHQALELVKRLCTEVAKSNILIAPQIFVTPLHQAISFGIREIVEEILKSDPNVINLRTIEDQTIFQYAIMCRSESVFNLIYQLEDYSHALLSSQDKSSNNALHLAGFLGPMQQLKVSAAGPALQVQRELQWFKNFLHQILEGLAYCHSNKILLRGLKPESLLLDHGNQSIVKIADFGTAKSIFVPTRRHTKGRKVTSQWYRAPELLLGAQKYTEAVDMWAVGFIFAEMAIQQPLFAATTEIEQLNKIFSILGKPCEATWPGVTALFPTLASFVDCIPKDLNKVLPDLEPDGVDLVYAECLIKWKSTSYLGQWNEEVLFTKHLTLLPMNLFV